MTNCHAPWRKRPIYRLAVLEAESRRTEDHGTCGEHPSWWLRDRVRFLLSACPRALAWGPFLQLRSRRYRAESFSCDLSHSPSPPFRDPHDDSRPADDQVSRVKSQFCRLASLAFALSPDVATGSGRRMFWGSMILLATAPFTGLLSPSVARSLFLTGLSWDPFPNKLPALEVFSHNLLVQKHKPKIRPKKESLPRATGPGSPTSHRGLAPRLSPECVALQGDAKKAHDLPDSARVRKSSSR